MDFLAKLGAAKKLQGMKISELGIVFLLKSVSFFPEGLLFEILTVEVFFFQLIDLLLNGE